MGGLRCLPMRLQPPAMLALMLPTVALGGCAGSHPMKHASFAGATYPPGIVAPDFKLQDEQGHAVSLSDYRGKVVALTFTSSDCRTCTLVAQQIRGALDELGSPPGVSTIFVSTKPQTDTPARVTPFLDTTSLTSRAVYLTGSRPRLERSWRAYHVRTTE